jgi:hypothetical protein
LDSSALSHVCRSPGAASAREWRKARVKSIIQIFQSASIRRLPVLRMGDAFTERFVVDHLGGQ